MNLELSQGTIYFRDNNWYKKENVIKMGVSSYAKDRSSVYITGEVIRIDGGIEI